MKFNLIILLAFLFAAPMMAQCEKFSDSPKESEAKEAHVLYRDQVKLKNYDAAFDYWQKAFSIAPAADGLRDFQYTDGITIYKHKMKNETDEARKKEYAKKIIELYDAAIECHNNGGIKLAKTTPESRVAYLEGRKAFDMFYELRTPYSQVYDAVKNAVDKGGNKVEYITFVPYATVVEYLFTNDKMDKATARDAYKKLNDIADHNIKNNKKYTKQFEQAKEAMNAVFARIENNIFDCDYFVTKLEPEFEAQKNNPEFLESTIRTLKRQGCEDSNPFLAKLEGKWAVYADSINRARQAEFERNNPGVMAKKLYDEGDYKGAIDKYEEAIEQETDPSKQAGYYFSIASIQFRKLNSYAAARSSARTAAQLRPGWGRPYMLIGDMYGSSARNCGDSWDQRLAILAAIDKYAYARSIDEEVASEASSRIGKYSASKPEQEEGFMRGVKAGQKVTVGCWIGETVSVSFK